MKPLSLHHHDLSALLNARGLWHQRLRQAPAVIVAALLALLGASALRAAEETSSAEATAEAAADARFRSYIALLRADLRAGKVEIFNNVMQLGADEAKVFWPIYQDYESEFFALGDRRLALLQKFSAHYRKATLDDAVAKSLSKEWLKQQEARLKLWAKYQKRIEKELSAIRAAQFLQIENRVNALTDLMIASEVPLPEPGMGANAGADKP